MSIDPNTKLYDLPDEVVDRCDGPLYELVQRAGYNTGLREHINNWNAWGITVSEFAKQLSGEIAFHPANVKAREVISRLNGGVL